jgi:hypothetical protein
VSDGHGTPQAKRICSGEAAQVAAEPAARARHEERHRGRDRRHVLRRRWCCRKQCGDEERLQDAHKNCQNLTSSSGM